jgi:hypothetical protein
MKKMIILFALLISGFRLSAQKYQPEIKQGTVFSYQFHLHGQTARFILTAERITDSLVLKWSIRYLAGGTYMISKAALQNGDALNWAQPAAGAVVKLPGHQTFCMISRSAYKSLKSNGFFIYNQTRYDTKTDDTTAPVVTGSQSMDVVHVVAENDPTEMWILNNDEFPLICRIQHNPLGIDIDLDNIKQPGN